MALIDLVSRWSIPALLTVTLTVAWLRRVDVYSEFIAGAEEGVRLTVRVAPYVISIFVAIQIFRSSGAMDLLARALQPLLGPLGVPSEVLPLLIIRPLSGNGALGVTMELMHHWGPDSTIGRLASVVQGSTDTTFYVLAFYFGSVGIYRIRHALIVGLVGDLAGFFGAVLAVHWFFR